MIHFFSFFFTLTVFFSFQRIWLFSVHFHDSWQNSKKFQSMISNKSSSQNHFKLENSRLFDDFVFNIRCWTLKSRDQVSNFKRKERKKLYQNKPAEGKKLLIICFYIRTIQRYNVDCLYHFFHIANLCLRDSFGEEKQKYMNFAWRVCCKHIEKRHTARKT